MKMNCHLCKCCKEKQAIKYTNVDDINKLINEFSANITKKWGQELIYHDLYDLYYETIQEQLLDRLGFITPEKIIELLEGKYFEEEIDEILNYHDKFDYIFDTYVPKVVDKFDLFDNSDIGHLGEFILERFMGKFWEMVHEVYLDLVPIFISRIKNKNFINNTNINVLDDDVDNKYYIT